jgi:hypothetical protein
MAAAVLAAGSVPVAFASELPRLAFETVVGMSVYLAVVFSIDRKLAPELKSIVRDIALRPARS